MQRQLLQFLSQYKGLLCCTADPVVVTLKISVKTGDVTGSLLARFFWDHFPSWSKGKLLEEKLYFSNLVLLFFNIISFLLFSVLFWKCLPYVQLPLSLSPPRSVSAWYAAFSLVLTETIIAWTKTKTWHYYCTHVWCHWNMKMEKKTIKLTWDSCTAAAHLLQNSHDSMLTLCVSHWNHSIKEIFCWDIFTWNKLRRNKSSVLTWGAFGVRGSSRSFIFILALPLFTCFVTADSNQNKGSKMGLLVSGFSVPCTSAANKHTQKIQSYKTSAWACLEADLMPGSKESFSKLIQHFWF